MLRPRGARATRRRGAPTAAGSATAGWRAATPTRGRAADGRRRAAHPACEEVEGAADADPRRGPDGDQVSIQEEFLPAGAEGRQHHLGPRLLDLLRRGLSRWPVAHRHDLQPRVHRDHAIARRTGDTRRPADQSDTVVVALRHREVRADKVGATDALDLRVAAAAQCAHQADAIRHHQGCGLEHRAERLAAPRHHHHLGVEGDHHTGMRRLARSASLHDLDECLHGGRHVDDVDRAPEHTSPHRRSRGGPGVHPTAWCTAAPSVLASDRTSCALSHANRG